MGNAVKNSRTADAAEAVVSPEATVRVAPNRSSTGLSPRRIAALASASVALHAGLWWYLNAAPPAVVEVPPKIPEMVVELTSPTPPAPPPPEPAPPPPPPPPPEPVPEPPKAPEPPPVDENAVKPPPKPEPPKPKPVPKPVHKPVPKPAPPVAPAAPRPPAPLAPAAPAAAPAPVKETPAVSGLASLGNPPPEYPSLALRRGWEGSVTLRIRVLPNGRAGAVEVTRSSGRAQLDEAAVAAVKGWKFIPAKRGDTPIEGIAVQTIDFKLPSE